MFKTLAVSISLIVSPLLNHIGDYTIQNFPTVDDIPTPKTLATDLLQPYPILVSIARCESGMRQFDASGKVLQGVLMSTDRGYFQISEHYWKEEATSKGMDIETLDGNIRFGIDLYKRFGTSPWSSSRGCWSKNLPAIDV